MADPINLTVIILVVPRLETEKDLEAAGATVAGVGISPAEPASLKSDMARVSTLGLA